MTPTKTILALLITVQFALASIAQAVETTTSTTTSKTAPKNTTAKTKKAKPTAQNQKNKSISKKSAGKNKLSKTKAAALTTAKPITEDKLKSVMTTTTTNVTQTTEPKPAIETEVETIESMEAAVVAQDAARVAKMKKPAVPVEIVSVPSTTTTSVATKPAAEEAKFLNYNISIAAGYNQGAEKPEKGDENKYMAYDIIPSMTIGPVKALMWFTYQQNLVDDKSSEWQDFPILLTVAKPYNAGDYITLSPATSVTVPQTKATKDGAQLNYSVNVNTTIGLNTKTLGWNGVVLNFQTGYSKMNNEFTTTSAGEPTTSYRFRQRLNFWYPVIENLTFKSRLQFDSNFSYENVVRNNFLHFELLEYGFLGKYTASIGHTNAGSIYNPAYEGNFKFYSSESSEYFIGLGADF